MKRKTFLILILFVITSVELFCQNLQEISKRAQQYLETKDYEAALKDANIILKRFPENVEMINLKGKVLLAMGDVNAGCSCIIEGIEQHSKSSENLFIKHCERYIPILDIERFKEGEFVYVVDDGSFRIKIVRKGNKHTEHFLITDTYIHSTINWDKNNTYTLEKIETNDSFIAEHRGDLLLICRIIKTTEDTYWYQVDHWSGRIIFGEIKKIK